MPLIFRKIEEKDQNKPFMTCRYSFNQKNPSGTLKEFYNESSEYKTWVLELNREIIGIARFRNESGMHPRVKQVFYISRVGVKKGFEHKGYAKYLYKKIFNYITKEIDFSKSFCIYFLIPEEDLDFWKNYLENFEEITSITNKKEDKDWGNYYIIKIISIV